MGVTFQGCVSVLWLWFIAWPLTKNITIPLLQMVFGTKSRIKPFAGRDCNIYEERAAGRMEVGVAFIGGLDE